MKSMCCPVVNNPWKRYITASLKDEFLHTVFKSHNVDMDTLWLWLKPISYCLSYSYTY